MIGTELLSGQGLGNQLFCYVTVRCLAEKLGYDFGILGQDTMANNIHSDCGLYFMNLDYGKTASLKNFTQRYDEKEDRLFVGTSKHDIIHGTYVTGTDSALFKIKDGTLIMGNMQAEDYFLPYKEQIKKWLELKPEYECWDYSQENLCILHLRCTDYMDSPELFLQKRYWLNGMKYMKTLNSDMKFMIITNDVIEANKLLPGIPAYNFDLAKDYSIIKNAQYLLLANSSFTYFPSFCSDTLKYAIAPKYWARHNVSDGYWASEQNIYHHLHYMDREGKIFSPEQCRVELEQYKKESKKYQRINQRAEKVECCVQRLQAYYIYERYRLERICRGIIRRLRKF